jgi:hypothetical protein
MKFNSTISILLPFRIPLPNIPPPYFMTNRGPLSDKPTAHMEPIFFQKVLAGWNASSWM